MLWHESKSIRKLCWKKIAWKKLREKWKKKCFSLFVDWIRLSPFFLQPLFLYFFDIRQVWITFWKLNLDLFFNIFESFESFFVQFFSDPSSSGFCKRRMYLKAFLCFNFFDLTTLSRVWFFGGGNFGYRPRCRTPPMYSLSLYLFIHILFLNFFIYFLIHQYCLARLIVWIFQLHFLTLLFNTVTK